jgi:hypothetical protein
MEIEQFSDADRGRVQNAVALESRLRARDLRQCEPYVNHLLRS